MVFAMSHYPTKEQTLHAAEVIGDIVDARTASPFEDDSGEYEVVHIPLETPTVIGGKHAVALRIAKALSGDLEAVATYHADEDCQTMPLRHITLAKDGEAEGVFDGTMDANSYRLPASYLVDLEADLESVLV